jgi:hypothetical protein
MLAAPYNVLSRQGAQGGAWRKQMKCHWRIVAVSVLSLATIDAGYAAEKHRTRAAHAPVPVARAPSFAPARMIEIRPGLFISSYDCITDEGYGRYSPCSGAHKN